MVTQRQLREEARRKLLVDAGLLRPPSPFERVTTPQRVTKKPKIPKTPGRTSSRREVEERLRETAPLTPEILREATTGEVKGVRLPGHPTAIWGGEKDVSGLIENFYTKQPLTGEPQEAEVVGRRRAEARTAQEFIAEQPPGPMPMRPSLVPEPGVFEGVPGIGPSLAVLLDLKAKSLQFGIKRKDVLNDLELRNEALGLIEERMIEDNLTISEEFGAAIEALPFRKVPLVGGYMQEAIGLSTTEPAEIVSISLARIKEQRSRALRLGRMVRRGTLSPRTAYSQIMDSYNRIQEIENRIYLATHYSTALRGNPDQIHRVEDAIEMSKEGIIDAANSAVMQLTGQEEVREPTDTEIMQELDEGKMIDDLINYLDEEL